MLEIVPAHVNVKANDSELIESIPRIIRELVSQERRCKRGGGYRLQAKSYNRGRAFSGFTFDSELVQKEMEA